MPEIPAALEATIYANYQRKRPIGAEYREWLTATATEYGLTTRQVGRIVGLGDKEFTDQLTQSRKSQAQRLADLMGVQAADAIEVLGEQLHATNRRILTDKNGRIKRDCSKCDGAGKILEAKHSFQCSECKGTGGKEIWVEKPDNAARLRAIELLFKLHGAMAPDRVEINATHTHYNVSKEQLAERLGELYQQLRTHLRPGSAGEIQGSGSDQPGTEGSDGD